jgi:hypothetical protein
MLFTSIKEQIMIHLPKLINNENPSRRNFLKTTTVGVLSGAGLLNEVGNGINGFQAAAATADVSKLPRIKQKMIAPPFLPEHE